MQSSKHGSSYADPSYILATTTATAKPTTRTHLSPHRPRKHPMDGDWTCDWDVSGQNNDLFTLQLQATDGYNLTSGWGAGQIFLLDTQAPTVILDIRVYGQDLVGNRTGDPLALDLIIDSVAPVIPVTTEITEGTLGETVVMLGGTVTDGGPATNLSVHVYWSIQRKSRSGKWMFWG